MLYTIDAKGQTLGRLATRVALLLQGKDKATYNPREIGNNKVVVKNAKLIKLTGKKTMSKVYHRHTGYMGHLRTAKYTEVFDKYPDRILRHAVRGMLPKNFIRDKRIKMLIIEK